MECNKCNKKLIRHVRGNTLTITVPLQEQVTQIIDGEKTKTTADFVPSQSDKVVLRLTHSDGRVMTFEDDKLTVNGNMVTVTDNGTINCGMWGVEVLILCASGRRLRFFSASVILVVNQTSEAGIDDGIEYNVEEYELEAAVFSVMRGFSAYEIWIQNGHQGTEEDFLEWLRQTDAASKGEIIDNNSSCTVSVQPGAAYMLKNAVTSMFVVVPKLDKEGSSGTSTVVFTAGQDFAFSAATGYGTVSTLFAPKFVAGSKYVLYLLFVRGTDGQQTAYAWFESALRKVAYTGSYKDLSDKPTIPDTSTFVPSSRKINGKALTGDITLDARDVGALPSNTPIPAEVTEQTVGNWGFTKNTGTYSKPATGIPASDLEEGVIPSLEGYATETWVGQQGYLTEHQDISGKDDKVAIATTLPDTLEVGTYYRLGSVATLSAALPTVSDTEHAASIMIGLAASADITPQLTASVPVYYQEGFEIKSGGVYEINCLWNGSYWSITTIKFETI